LSAAQRRRNLDAAFHVVEIDAIAGRSILLIDDVMTSGVTLGECANTLMLAGAARVDVATVSRALSVSEQPVQRDRTISDAMR
jgi:predicted amidophosphoribosyltransferase